MDEEPKLATIVDFQATEESWDGVCMDCLGTGRSVVFEFSRKPGVPLAPGPCFTCQGKGRIEKEPPFWWPVNETYPVFEYLENPETLPPGYLDSNEVPQAIRSWGEGAKE